MHTTLRASAALLSAIVATPLVSAIAQGSDLAISPFVSLLPSAGASPLAGLALTIGGSSGFALRGSARLALENSYSDFTNARTVRPWGADADVLLLLGGSRRSKYDAPSISPFAFVGIGSETIDDLGFKTTTHNWSYGAGAAIPFGSLLDVFGEGRWRMSRYVLPTASMAPSPTTELRFGVSFHVGSTQSDEPRRPRGRRSASRD